MADREHGDVVAFGEGGQRLEDPAHIHHSVRVDAAHVAGDRINDDESYVADFANRFLKSRKVGAKIEGPARTIFVGDCTQRMDTGHICTSRVEARPNGVGVTILSGKDDDVTARRAASVGPSGADRDACSDIKGDLRFPEPSVTGHQRQFCARKMRLKLVRAASTASAVWQLGLGLDPASTH